ncbi:LCP family protein [Janibacter alittae]|uniref:LCP family protein n=1 Tax=Janibacter alittae TaxID=3115209 RepID=A0ABZ2MG22_9MICO
MRDDRRGTSRSVRREERLRRRTRNRRRVLVGAGLVVALVATLAVATALHLDGNIGRVDIASGSEDRPEDIDHDLNILVIGSDTREGIGTDEYGTYTEDGANSDTNLLVHISADRESAYVISIPRDSMTMAPSDCADPSSTVVSGEMRQWNANFNQGGPACVVKTLEGLTGVFVDHVAVIDFSGFQSMVDGLGGVDVCLPRPVHDPDAQIDLPAGEQRLDGHDALGYVRMRKTLGNGSDLERIERQQAFMSSMAQEATRTSLLLRPDRLYSFLDAATKSMTADEDLGLKKMLSIARSVKDLGMDELTFITVPTEPYVADPNRVQWDQPAADALWAAVRDDTVLPGQEKQGGQTEPELTVAPSEISVKVRNDTRSAGLAAQEAVSLDAQGFRASVVNAPPTGQTAGVTVTHAVGEAAAARTVAAAYDGARLKVDEELPVRTVQVSLGLGAPNAEEVPNREGDAPLPEARVHAPPAPTQIETRTADQDICG